MGLEFSVGASRRFRNHVGRLLSLSLPSPISVPTKTLGVFTQSSGRSVCSFFRVPLQVLRSTFLFVAHIYYVSDQVREWESLRSQPVNTELGG